MSYSGQSYFNSRKFTDECHKKYSPYIYKELLIEEDNSRPQYVAEYEDNVMEIDYTANFPYSRKAVNIQERFRTEDSTLKPNGGFYNDVPVRFRREGSNKNSESEWFKFKKNGAIQRAEDNNEKFLLIYSVVNSRETDPQKAIKRTIAIDLLRLNKAIEDGRIVPNQINPGMNRSDRGSYRDGVYHCQQIVNKKDEHSPDGFHNSSFCVLDPRYLCLIDQDIVYFNKGFYVPERETAMNSICDKNNELLLFTHDEDDPNITLTFNRDLSQEEAESYFDILANTAKEYCMTAEELIKNRPISIDVVDQKYYTLGNSDYADGDRESRGDDEWMEL